MAASAMPSTGRPGRPRGTASRPGSPKQAKRTVHSLRLALADLLQESQHAHRLVVVTLDRDGPDRPGCRPRSRWRRRPRSRAASPILRVMLSVVLGLMTLIRTGTSAILANPIAFCAKIQSHSGPGRDRRAADLHGRVRMSRMVSIPARP